MPRRTLKQAGLIVFVALGPALAAAFFHPRAPAWSREGADVPEIAPSQIARWSGSVLLVDARGETAFQRGHIPGAILLNEDRWDDLAPALLEAWQPGLRIVVYCDRQCNSSQEVARRLRREMGLENVFVLKGGWETWNGSPDP